MSGKSKKRLDEAEQEAMQSELSESLLFHQSTSGQVDKPAKPHVDKYTTHLRPETIKAIKRWAFEHEIKDYEVVQIALDAFFLERGL